MSIDTKELAEKCTRAIFDDESETPEEFAEAIRRELDAALPKDQAAPPPAAMAEMMELLRRANETGDKSLPTDEEIAEHRARQEEAAARQKRSIELHEASEERGRAAAVLNERQTVALERIANVLEGKGRVVPHPPFVTPKGSLCGLCDSPAGCSHPQSRCTCCDAYGLAENMVRHECAGKPGVL